jgi:hypothetical protein
MILQTMILHTISALLLAVLPVSVKTSEGKVTEADLHAITPSSLVLDQDGQIVEYAFDDLLSLRPIDAVDKSGTLSKVVTLVGGSRIRALDLSLIDSELLIDLRRQNQLLVPLKDVNAIRYRPSSVTTDAQWLGILDRPRRGDTLVIRRAENRLDPQQGIIESISGGLVGFNLDGTPINAPVDRLEGLVFGGTQSLVEDTDVRVTDIYGSTWSVIAIEPSRGDQPLQMRLSSNVVHELPLYQIDSIRWSGGFSLLADEKPAKQSFQPYFQVNVTGGLLEEFFSPQRVGEADLQMFGGSSVEYRIEAGYELVVGSVRREEHVTSAGIVTVQIALDDKIVWTEELLDGEPRGFELPVNQARRLTFVVDSGPDGDLGDTVRIARPRLLK